MKSRKIAFLGIKCLPAKAGADRAVEAIVQRLDKRKFEITVYCSSRLTPKAVSLPGIKLIRIPALRGKHLHATSLFLFSAFHALCFANYDLVHVHNVEACFVLLFLRLRYKVISTSQGTAYKLAKWGKVAKALIRLTEYPFMALSNCITCVSSALAREYELKYGKKVHFLPNGVDMDIECNNPMQISVLEAFGIEGKDYVLFAAGRVIPEKGCHLLLEAWSRLDTDALLVVVGDTAQMPEYEVKLKRMSDDRVRFIPFISCKEDLFAVIRSCRIFVFPSMIEAMSLTLLEVASLGRPLICSDIAENSCVLPERALYFKSGDCTDLEKCLRWALSNSSAMEDLAVRAQSWVKENYDWDVIVRGYEMLYDAVCNE